MAEGKFQIVIEAKDLASPEIKKVLDSLKDSASSAEILDQKMSSVSDSFLDLTAQAGVLMSSLYGIKRIVESLFSAYEQQESAQRLLTYSLQRLTSSVDDAILGFSQWATALQEATGFSDDAILSAIRYYSQVGTGNATIQEAVRATLDFSRATGKDLNEAMMAIHMGAIGMGRSLKMYGIQVSKNLSPQQKMVEILKQIKVLYGGIAEKEAQSLSGQMRVLKALFDDVKESAGGVIAQILISSGVLNTMRNILVITNNALQGFANWFKTLPPWVSQTVIAFAGLATAFLGSLTAIKSGIVVYTALKSSFSILSSQILPALAGSVKFLASIFNATTAIIVAAVAIWGAVAYSVVANWNEVKYQTADLVKSVSNFFTQLGNWLLNFVQTLWSGIVNALNSFGKAVLGFLISLWAKIQNLFGQLYDYVSSFMPSVINTIKEWLIVAYEFWAEIFGKIYNKIKQVADWLGIQFKGAGREIADAAGYTYDYWAKTFDSLRNKAKETFSSLKTGSTETANEITKSFSGLDIKIPITTEIPSPDSLKNLSEEQKRLAEQSKTIHTTERQEIEMTNSSLQSLQQQWESVGSSIQSQMSDALASVIMGEQSMTEAMKSLSINILKQFLAQAIAAIWAVAFRAMLHPAEAPARIGWATAMQAMVTGIITGLMGFAKGGIVTKPTVGLIGEAGPEAIIPLKKLKPSKPTAPVIINLQSSFFPSSREIRRVANRFGKFLAEEFAR